MASSETDDKNALQQYLMRLLTRREYSRHELLGKCEQKGFDEALSVEVLELFRDNNWQSDERFAETYFRNRLNRGYGPLRIRQDMRIKGLEEDLITEQMAGVNDWQPLIEELWKKKFNRKAENDREKARQFRYLAQRGFYQQDIYQIINRRNHD